MPCRDAAPVRCFFFGLAAAAMWGDVGALAPGVYHMDLSAANVLRRHSLSSLSIAIHSSAPLPSWSPLSMHRERVLELVAPEQVHFNAHSGGLRPLAGDQVDGAHLSRSVAQQNLLTAQRAAQHSAASSAVSPLRDIIYGFSILFDPLSILSPQCSMQ